MRHQLRYGHCVRRERQNKFRSQASNQKLVDLLFIIILRVERDVLQLYTKK